MSHVIFFLSQFLLFTLICCFLLTKLKVIKINLYPLLPMTLYLLAQSTGLYLTNINTQVINWIYEVQEIAMVISTGTIYLYLNKEQFFKKLYVRYIFFFLSISTVIMYLLGNFIYLPLWVISFTWSKGIMYLTLYYGTCTYLRKKRSKDRYYLLFFILLTLLFICELPIPVISTFLTNIKVDLFTPLLLCSLWLYIDLKESNRQREELLTEDLIQIYKLTTREIEVTTKLIQGSSYQEIADELFLSKATIKTYINRVYKKVDVNNKVELIHQLLSNK